MRIPVLLWLAVCCLSGRAFGQEGPTCELCATASDVTCGDFNCNSGDGCGNVLFTAPCTGNYTFKFKLTCNSPDVCTYCRACARLVNADTGTEVAMRTINDPTCGSGCTPLDASYLLTQYTHYKLEVCLSPCPEIDCTSCDNCEAKARVMYPGSDCTAW